MRRRSLRESRTRVLSWITFLSLLALDVRAEDAYQVYGKKVTVEKIAEQDRAAFFELEKAKYTKIEAAAHSAFLDEYWKKKAQEAKTTPEKARENFNKQKIKVTDKQIKEVLEQFKNHPQLSKLPQKEQEAQVRDYLEETQSRALQEEILAEAIKKGELKILLPEPQEPIYDLAVTSVDHVRYGPNEGDTKPMGCEGSVCPITIIEYSEFECPFCSRVLAATKQVLDAYKGKVRWITRDFPLESIHKRARPAAIAAKCASFQGKYWDMYYALFNNQGKFSDKDLQKYGTDIGLNSEKYNQCLNSPSEANKIIDENINTGAKYGINGTPGYFINGRKLSGSLPFAEFKKVIDSELAKADAKAKEKLMERLKKSNKG